MLGHNSVGEVCSVPVWTLVVCIDFVYVLFVNRGGAICSHGHALQNRPRSVCSQDMHPSVRVCLH